MFCPNCGANVQGRFCAKCGTAVDAPASAQASGAASSAPPPGAQAYSTGATPGAQPYSAPATAGGLADNVAGALCYALGIITGILFLVLAPYNQNKFVRFHAFQSLFFQAAWIVVWIAITTLSFILPWFVMGLIWTLLPLVGLGLWLLLMFKAYQNERFKLPVIGDLAEKQA
jgi:uncharacterized membrane protein